MIKLIELFSGIGSQTAAFQKLGMEHELVGVAEIDKDAVLSYAASHCAYNEIHKSYKYPSAEVMAKHLEKRNIGFDFKKGKAYDWRKHIDKKTGEARPDLKKYYLASVLANNFGDISRIDRLGYADFWTYSFPCQDISVAGLQKGINKGTRSGLLYEVERLLEVANTHNELPKYLMLENVKNLVSKKFRKQFFEWIRRLEEFGYNTYWQVLNAKDYGIPQNRERVFAISIRKDIDKGYQFPKPFDNGVRLKHILEEKVDEKYYISSEKVNKILKSDFHQEKDIIQNKEICDTLLARDYKDPKCVIIPQATKQGYIKCDVPGVVDLTYPESKTRRGRVQDKGQICPTLMAGTQDLFFIEPKSMYGRMGKQAIETFKNNHCNFADTINPFNMDVNTSGLCPTLTTRPEGLKTAILPITNNNRVRKLTPLEWWILMGFTKEQFHRAEKVNSNSQLYKQAGNSIVVDVLYHIFLNLFTDVEEEYDVQLSML